MYNKDLPTQLVKYFGAGVTGTALHYLLLSGLVHYSGIGPVTASTCGAIAGAVVIYALNYSITFHSTRAHGVTMVRFFLVAGLGLIINGMALQLALSQLVWSLAPSQILATMLQSFFGFILNRLWTF
jgi:putative flippase GtrA